MLSNTLPSKAQIRRLTRVGHLVSDIRGAICEIVYFDAAQLGMTGITLTNEENEYTCSKQHTVVPKNVVIAAQAARYSNGERRTTKSCAQAGGKP
jgi:hypothetical protein